jgi:hypothetical protein
MRPISLSGDERIMGKTALIICGAVGQEVLDIVKKHAWDAAVLGISSMYHMHPEQIPAAVEKRLLEIRQQYERVIVVYGDCGTMGMLEETLARHRIEYLGGLNCYEWYSGAAFQQMMDEEPGTFFLTDFLVRAFHGSVIKGLGLDQYPDLKGIYFANYTRVLYLAQKPTDKLLKRAQDIADYLGLRLEVREMGYGALETRLVEMMESSPTGS